MPAESLADRAPQVRSVASSRGRIPPGAAARWRQPDQLHQLSQRVALVVSAVGEGLPAQHLDVGTDQAELGLLLLAQVVARGISQRNVDRGLQLLAGVPRQRDAFA